MKAYYLDPELEIILFRAMDILTRSDPHEDDTEDLEDEEGESPSPQP